MFSTFLNMQLYLFDKYMQKKNSFIQNVPITLDLQKKPYKCIEILTLMIN